MLNPTAINALIALSAATASASITHFMHRKRDRADYEAKLMSTISELSAKYIEINNKTIEMSDKIVVMSDKIMELENENQQLKKQIIKLKNCQDNG